MLPLCRRLNGEGYCVENWGYPTLRSSVTVHAANLRAFMLELETRGQRFHIVAHSMGSVIVRTALQGIRMDCIKRIVFLAPPSRGSTAATIAGKILGIGRLCRPLTELSTAPGSFVNSIEDTPDYAIGVIAAKYDLLVSVERTHLTFERDHVVLNATHNSLLISKQVSHQVCRFFETGCFDHV
jgi:pimeloyl-ACP methyl ester carboxylesterase